MIPDCENCKNLGGNCDINHFSILISWNELYLVLNHLNILLWCGGKVLYCVIILTKKGNKINFNDKKLHTTNSINTAINNILALDKI
jgi:hypothetical protein